MVNNRELMTAGRLFEIELSDETAVSVMREPTQLSVLYGMFGICFADRALSLSGFDRRFEVVLLGWVDLRLTSCVKALPMLMKVTLGVTETASRARTLPVYFDSLAHDVAAHVNWHSVTAESAPMQPPWTPRHQASRVHLHEVLHRSTIMHLRNDP